MKRLFCVLVLVGLCFGAFAEPQIKEVYRVDFRFFKPTSTVAYQIGIDLDVQLALYAAGFNMGDELVLSYLTGGHVSGRISQIINSIPKRLDQSMEEVFLKGASDKGNNKFEYEDGKIVYLDWVKVSPAEWKPLVAGWAGHVLQDNEKSAPVVNGISTVALTVENNSFPIASMDNKLYKVFALDTYLIVWDDGQFSRFGR